MRGKVRPSVGVLVGAVLSISACGTSAGSGGDVTADDAVLCRELGGGVVHVRYETDEGTRVRTQLGLGPEDAGGGLSAEAVRVLEARGWDEGSLEQLDRPDDPDPEVAARLEEMPDCLDRLRDAGG